MRWMNSTGYFSRPRSIPAARKRRRNRIVSFRRHGFWIDYRLGRRAAAIYADVYGWLRPQFGLRCVEARITTSASKAEYMFSYTGSKPSIMKWS